MGPLKHGVGRDSVPGMASKLPEVFARLTADDWTRVRRMVDDINNDDVESVATSVGYIDVGKSIGGQAFVGAMSMDAAGGGGLLYRKVPVMLWPRAKVGDATRSAFIVRVEDLGDTTVKVLGGSPTRVRFVVPAAQRRRLEVEPSTAAAWRREVFSAVDRKLGRGWVDAEP